ncbi:MAG: DUF4922 domain-containing protein [Desulfosudis oleivorans]|nr:DUF4922 domain-containing protein [Desulfosudis oleivorans]
MVNIAGFLMADHGISLYSPAKNTARMRLFKEGDERIVVSPGVVEMAGVLVTPMEKDFERLDTEAVEGIYREVSLDGKILTKVMKDNGVGG